MDLLRSRRVTTVTGFSLAMGSGRDYSFVLLKNVILQNEQNIDLLYPPALGTIPIGLLGLTSLKPII